MCHTGGMPCINQCWTTDAKTNGHTIAMGCWFTIDRLGDTQQTLRAHIKAAATVIDNAFWIVQDCHNGIVESF